MKREQKVKIFKRLSLYFAWVIALVATCMSLYASEILNYKACIFCWYQRVFMFPLAIILGIATYRRDKKIISYVIAFPIIGAIIAFVQSTLPYFASYSFFCAGDCSEEKIKLFGFLDFSIASFFAFSAIFGLLPFSKKKEIKE